MSDEEPEDCSYFLQWFRHSIFELPEGLSERIIKYEDRKWKIANVEPYGRCVVATEDIAEGEILLVDQPIITGPKQSCPIMCLGCYKQLDIDDYYKCSKCRWPMCSIECESLGYHHLECGIFSKSGYSPSEADLRLEEVLIYEPILPLRSYLLQRSHQLKWNTFSGMESHNDLRRNGLLWQSEQVNIIEFLNEKGNLGAEDEDLHTVIGVLDVNCHEVRSNIIGTNIEYRVRGIYPLCAMMSHQCNSNTHHTIVDNMYMLVVASTNIPKGHQLTATYTHLLSPTTERRKHLKHGKFFDCECMRCRDPTELGTYFGALLCSQLGCGGPVICKNPLDPTNNSDYACATCKFSIKAGMVNRLNNMVYYEIDNLQSSDPMCLEQIFNKYRNILHPNHFHMVSIKHTLSQTYGRVPNFYIDDLTDSQVDRKVKCCLDLLAIIDVLDPGISRLRGLTYYEMHAPLLTQANREFKLKNLTKECYLKKLRDVLDMLDKTVYSLKFEPLSSYEGETCRVARGSKADLEKWTANVEGLSNDNFLSENCQVFSASSAKQLSEEDMTLEALLKKIEEY